MVASHRQNRAYACRQLFDIRQVDGDRRHPTQLERSFVGRDVGALLVFARAAANRVCDACYKSRLADADAQADKTARLVLVPAKEPLIAIEVTGQLESNKEDLYAMGFRWADSNAQGVMGVLSTARPLRVLSCLHKVQSVELMARWIAEMQARLAEVGYPVVLGLNALDGAFLQSKLAEKAAQVSAVEHAKEQLAAIAIADPQPAASPLRLRIAEIEQATGAKWNGKIYGRAGSYNFYVADKRYSATDAEIREREAVNKLRDEWAARHAELLRASKGAGSP